jgi:sterol 14-demethylase
MMVPVFGEGIQYGAPPDIERQQLKMQVQGLKHDRMVNYAGVVERESEDFIQDWGDSGEFDIYEAFTQLTLKTSTHCLLGADFRYQLTALPTDRRILRVVSRPGRWAGAVIDQ